MYIYSLRTKIEDVLNIGNIQCRPLHFITEELEDQQMQMPLKYIALCLEI